MNYTDTYKKIYEVVSKLGLPHDNTHNASLRIADALNDIYVYTNRQFPEILPEILHIAEGFCADAKVGGYDLDDKGNPVGFGIKASGLNNSL